MNTALITSFTFSLTAAACTAPAFDIETWRAAKLAEIQPHPLAAQERTSPLSVARSVFDAPMDQQVSAIAPELSNRIIGRRFNSAPWSQTVSIIFDETPVAIAPHVCRQIAHPFTASLAPPPPGSLPDQIQSVELWRNPSDVGFFAAEADGTCPYDRDRPGFPAASDARAITLLTTARSIALGLRTGALRVHCGDGLPDCRADLQTAFDPRRITHAGSCTIDMNCVAFDLPGTDAIAPNRLHIETPLGDPVRSIMVTAISPYSQAAF